MKERGVYLLSTMFNKKLILMNSNYLKALSLLAFLSFLTVSCEKEFGTEESINDKFIESYTYLNQTFDVQYTIEDDSIIYVLDDNYYFIDSLLSEESKALLFKDDNVYVFDTEYDLTKYIESLPKLKTIPYKSRCYMWEHPSRGGRKLDFSDYSTCGSFCGIAHLRVSSTLNFNDIVTSIECTGPSYWTFYEDINYSGKSFTVYPHPTNGWYYANLNDKWHSGTLWWEKSWNDRISSVKKRW